MNLSLLHKMLFAQIEEDLGKPFSRNRKGAHNHVKKLTTKLLTNIYFKKFRVGCLALKNDEAKRGEYINEFQEQFISSQYKELFSNWNYSNPQNEFFAKKLKKCLVSREVALTNLYNNKDVEDRSLDFFSVFIGKNGWHDFNNENLRLTSSKNTFLRDLENADHKEDINNENNLGVVNSLLLHYFDHYFLEMKGYRYNYHPEIYKEALLATKIAFLFSKKLLVPVSSYFESKMCRDIVDTFRDVFHMGKIQIVSSAYSIEEYIETQLTKYRKDSLPYKTYTELLKKNQEYHPPVLTHTININKEIMNGWDDLIENSDKPIQIIKSLNLSVNMRVFEENWKLIPEKLQNFAFTVDHVKPMLGLTDCNLIACNNSLHAIINQLYFKSYTDKYKAGIVRDLNYLESSSFNLHSSDTSISFLDTVNYLKVFDNLYEKILQSGIVELFDYKNQEEWKTLFNTLSKNKL